MSESMNNLQDKANNKNDLNDQPEAFLIGHSVLESKEMKSKKHNWYSSILDQQCRDKKVKKEELKLKEQKEMRESIEKQLAKAKRFEERNKRKHDRQLSNVNNILDQQLAEKIRLAKENPKQDIFNYKGFEQLPPPDPSLVKNSFPSVNERCKLTRKVVEMLKDNGNMNKDYIDYTLDPKESYNQLKKTYGNHSGRYNILTGH